MERLVERGDFGPLPKAAGASGGGGSRSLKRWFLFGGWGGGKGLGRMPSLRPATPSQSAGFDPELGRIAQSARTLSPRRDKGAAGEPR